MMTMADNNGTRDWVADHNGEGRERAARDGGDSGVAIIAAEAEDRVGGQQRQRWSMTVVDDDGTQDWVADYDGEGREQVTNNGIRRPTRQRAVKK
jgi:hypothetical protein